MPIPSPPLAGGGGALFLGLELSVDQLRASLVDESLDLVGVDVVDFDSELPEYQTHGGIFTTPGEAYTTPVEMWVKALDLLLEKIHRHVDVSRIKAIGGSAQHAVVWWKSTTVPSFSSIDPRTPLHHNFPSQLFSLPNVSTAQDTSAHQFADKLEALMGGADHMAARVGLCADSSLVAAQLMRVREMWPTEVWARTGRVQLACNFIGTLLLGKWMNISEPEAVGTGMWVHNSGNNTVGVAHTGVGQWDEGVLDIVGGSREEGRRVRGWLGEVDVSGGAKKAGNVSRYLVERYGFDPETIVTPFTTDSLSSYLSMCPSPSDAVLAFGPIDQLLTPAQHWLPTRLYTLYPHPAQDLSTGEKRRYIAVLTSRNADIPRALVRDMYTKSWSAFDRLVAIVPPGGSIGLDDKLFSFYHLQPEAYPFSHVKGIYRFETGIKVNEFRDLRANPRCLIESQVLSFRVRWSRLIGTGVLGAGKRGVASGGRLSANASPAPPPVVKPATRIGPNGLNSYGLSFDPYDPAQLPARLLTTGATANFPSVAALLADVFNTDVWVTGTQLDSAKESGNAHRNKPGEGFPSRASLGCAYLSRWVWGRDPNSSASSPSLPSFEDEIKRLLIKRWTTSGGRALKTNANGNSVSASLTAGVGGTGSGRTTPGGGGSAYGRSGLGNSVLVEEEEEEEGDGDAEGSARLGGSVASVNSSQGVARGGFGGGPGSPFDPQLAVGGGTPRSRTATGDSTTSTVTSGGFGTSGSLSTAHTSPDLSLGPVPSLSFTPSLNPSTLTSLSASGQASSLNPSSNGSGPSSASGEPPSATTPTTPTPLLPVAPIPTSAEDAQMGLVKVAEHDLDSFLGYAGIVVEYSRLEGMLVKGVVI